MNQRKAGAILSYLSMFFGFGINIIYTPYMLRKLGVSEYGLYTLVASTINYLSLLSFGLGASYIRIYSRYKSNKEEKKISELNGMYLSVFIGIAVLSLIIGGFLANKINLLFGSKLTVHELETAKILMFILTLNITLTFPKSIFNIYIQANERFIFSKLLQMFNVFLTPILTVVALFMGYKSKGLVMVTLIMQIVTFIGSIIYCKKKLKMTIKFNNFDFKLMKEIFVFSSFIFLEMVIVEINWNVDKIILGRYWGSSKVAIYGVASLLNSYYVLISTNISNVFVTKINEIVVKNESEKELSNIFTKIGRIQFLIMMLILSGIYIFGKSFIKMWAGSEYLNAYYILLILITPLSIPLIQNIGVLIQKAKNKHRFRSYVFFVIAIINVLVSIPLSKEYGGIGAAIGTSISLITGPCLIMNWYYYKHLKIDIKYFWKEIFRILPSLIIPIITGSYIYITFDLTKINNFFKFGVIYTLVYMISIWFLGMNNYERQLIKKILKKLI